MSKSSLKKELQQLDRNQLQQILLDIYSARKEAKQWLDFFVNPDLEALTEKYRAEIDKEMNRGKYSKSTTRLSKVRTLIKNYASFGIDPEAVISLMVYALKEGLRTERKKFVTKTFITGMARLASDILKEGDRYEIFNTAFSQLQEALSGAYGYINFVNYIRREIDWSVIRN